MSTPKTRQELANEYGICVRTLRRWITEAGLHIPRGSITPNHLKQIYDKIGKPANRENHHGSQES